MGHNATVRIAMESIHIDDFIQGLIETPPDVYVQQVYGDQMDIKVTPFSVRVKNLVIGGVSTGDDPKGDYLTTTTIV
jgi:hypothetical protein